MSLPDISSSEGLGSLPSMSPEKTKRNPLGSGRHPRVAGEVADERITMRLTASERTAYEAAAVSAGVTLGEWIRDTCNAHLKRKRRA